jgi:hypothetical protein
VDCLKKPADLAAEERLEKQTSHLLRRGFLLDSESCRRKLPRWSSRGLSPPRTRETELGGECEWGSCALLAETGLKLEPLRAVGRDPEMEVFVDQGTSLQSPPRWKRAAFLVFRDTGEREFVEGRALSYITVLDGAICRPLAGATG